VGRLGLVEEQETNLKWIIIFENYETTSPRHTCFKKYTPIRLSHKAANRVVLLSSDGITSTILLGRDCRITNARDPEDDLWGRKLERFVLASWQSVYDAESSRQSMADDYCRGPNPNDVSGRFPHAAELARHRGGMGRVCLGYQGKLKFYPSPCRCCIFSFIWDGMSLLQYMGKGKKNVQAVVEKHQAAMKRRGVDLTFFDKTGY
jgi:hypothetical protein